MQVSSIDGDSTAHGLDESTDSKLRVDERQPEAADPPCIGHFAAPRPNAVESGCQTEFPEEEESLCMQMEAFEASPVRKRMEIAAARSPGMWAGLSELDAIWLESVYAPVRRPARDQEFGGISAVDAGGMDFPPGLGETVPAKWQSLPATTETNSAASLLSDTDRYRFPAKRFRTIRNENLEPNLILVVEACFPLLPKEAARQLRKNFVRRKKLEILALAWAVPDPQDLPYLGYNISGHIFRIFSYQVH